MLKFGGILFTPIPLTAVACYAAGPMEVRFSFRSQNVPLPPPKPLQKHQYTHRNLVTMHFSKLTKMVLTRLAFIIACSGVHCGLKNQHWPMKRKLFLDQKVYCTHTIQTKVMLKFRDTHKYQRLQLKEGPQTCLF